MKSFVKLYLLCSRWFTSILFVRGQQLNYNDYKDGFVVFFFSSHTSAMVLQKLCYRVFYILTPLQLKRGGEVLKYNKFHHLAFVCNIFLIELRRLHST